MKSKMLNDRFMFLYGAFYDPEIQEIPEAGTADVIIYTNYRGEKSRAVGSLEGVFVSKEAEPFSNVEGEPLCRRNEMEAFAKRYKGRFIAFSEIDVLSDVTLKSTLIDH